MKARKGAHRPRMNLDDMEFHAEFSEAGQEAQDQLDRGFHILARIIARNIQAGLYDHLLADEEGDAPDIRT